MLTLTSNLTSMKLSVVLAALVAVTASLTGCAGDEDDTTGEESSQEAAFSVPNVPSSSDYPTESGWALAMIAKACDVTTASLGGAVGSIKRTDDGVFYTATRSNEVIASAWARSTFIGAQKRCLTR